MSHTCNYQHIIFRTYKSEKTIPEETKSVLFAYIKKICNNQGVQVLAINSHLDHIHILIELPATLCVAETVKYIKQSSSKAFHRHKYFPFFDGWGTGYAAFSVSMSKRATVINYINNQGEHHRIKTFREEYEAFLKANGKALDKYVFMDT